MTTRTFTLDDAEMAWEASRHDGCKDDGCRWDAFRTALLAAKPETTMGTTGHLLIPRAEKPEAKTSEPCPECARTADACPFHRWYPTPAASPPAWLPLGQHPGGACRDGCGGHFGAGEIHGISCWHINDETKSRQFLCFCCRYCRDRAKAVPRDAAPQGVPPDNSPPQPCPACEKGDRDGDGHNCIPPVAGQPGVPDGWKLAKGWRTEPRRRYVGCFGCGRQGMSDFIKGADFLYCVDCAKAEKGVVPDEPSRPRASPPTREPCDPSCYDPVDGWCSELCVQLPAEPSRPTSPPLRNGWTVATVDRSNCHRCKTTLGPETSMLRSNTGVLFCTTCAVELGALAVDIEPSRPVTGEVDWSRFLPTEEIVDDDGVVADALQIGDVFASWDASSRTARRSVRIAQEVTRDGFEGELLAGSDAWDSDRCRLIRHSDGRWADGYGPNGSIAPPAPGNHPGTPSQEALTVDCPECGAKAGQPCKVPKLSPIDRYHIPRFEAAREAPGKPDEAPLDLKEQQEQYLRDSNRDLRTELRLLKADHAAIEAKLAAAETTAELRREYKVDWDRLKREGDDLRSQLATRDARIAELEASYAADKAAAVLAERERVDGHWWAWMDSDDGNVQRRIEGIVSGAPAPSGGK